MGQSFRIFLERMTPVMHSHHCPDFDMGLVNPGDPAMEFCSCDPISEMQAHLWVCNTLMEPTRSPAAEPSSATTRMCSSVSAAWINAPRG